eukprot:7056461-Lingulodinium_polyedra.AAC.1
MVTELRVAGEPHLAVPTPYAWGAGRHAPRAPCGGLQDWGTEARRGGANNKLNARGKQARWRRPPVAR